jgi:hypothetical protein
LSVISLLWVAKFDASEAITRQRRQAVGSWRFGCPPSMVPQWHQFRNCTSTDPLTFVFLSFF